VRGARISGRRGRLGVHSDPDLNVPVTSPQQQAQQAEAAWLPALGYSAETAQYAAVPAGAEIAR
jgi:hypothetical protein